MSFYDDENPDKIVTDNEKSSFASFKQKIRDGELIKNISWTNIRNALSFKDTRMRIALPILVVTILTICVVTLCHEITSTNKDIQTFSSAAGQVCIEKMAEYGFCSYEEQDEEKYGKDVYRFVGLCFVRELDFDSDGKSELLICYNDGGIYYNEVYGFNAKDEFVCLYKKQACTVNDATHGDFITIYRHGGKYYIGTNESADDSETQIEDSKKEESTVQKIDLYTLSHNSFKKKASCEYDYINESFSTKGEVNLSDFEKIKLSCVKNAEGERRIGLVNDAISGFDTSNVNLDGLNNDQQRMYKAYYKKVVDYNAKYGSAKIIEDDGCSALSGLSVVKLVDFNGDSVEELMLIYSKEVSTRATDHDGNYAPVTEEQYFCEIYKWNGTDALRIFRSDCISSNDVKSDDRYYMIKKDGSESYYCENANSSSDRGKVTSSSARIFKMTDLNFTKTFDLTKQSNHGSTKYYLNNKYIKKREFNNEKADIPLFLTDTDTYDSTSYIVGYVKRPNDKKGNIDNQLTLTVETIKRLNPQYIHEQ